VTEKAYPEDEAVLTASISSGEPGAVNNKLVYERRFGARNQFELIVPFGWQETVQWNAGIGDVALGLKRALIHSLEKGSIFSIAAEVVLPTGNEDKGFGKGTTVFEPFVSFGQLFPRDFFLHAQGGLELPAEIDKAEREAFWRLALGRSFTQGSFGRSWAPMVELLAARELHAGGETSWDALPQFQVTLNRRQHIMLNLGIRVPVTDRATRDPALLVYLLWDWFDGGFLDGW
jgi:hypothetical protein